MTNDELLRNAIWVCNQCADLHRLTSDVCTLTQAGFSEDSLRPYMKRMQMILDAAGRVVAAHERRLAKLQVPV